MWEDNIRLDDCVSPFHLVKIIITIVIQKILLKNSDVYFWLTSVAWIFSLIFFIKKSPTLFAISHPKSGRRSEKIIRQKKTSHWSGSQSYLHSTFSPHYIIVFHIFLIFLLLIWPKWSVVRKASTAACTDDLQWNVPIFICSSTTKSQGHLTCTTKMDILKANDHYTILFLLFAVFQ